MYTPLISIDPRKCEEVCKRRVFPVDSDRKESTCKAKDLGLIPGWRRSSGEGNGYPLQYSCLGNPMDRGAWQATEQWGLKRVGHNLATKQQQQYMYS